jgi:hypothetical protein
MSVRSPARGDVTLFASAGVDAGVAMELHNPAWCDDRVVMILFGEERITLEFYDVESLERLRDLADAGARRLRSLIEENARPAGVEDETELS